MRRFQKSYELYNYNLMLIRKLADICGLDILAQNYKFNMRFLVVLALSLITAGSLLYSCVFYFQNWYKMLEIAIILAVMIQAIVKIYIAFIHRHFYETMYYRLRDFHYKYRNHQNHEQLYQTMEKIHLTTKLFLALYIFTGCSFSVYPLYIYLTERRRELLVCIRLPWIDVDSLGGYVVTMCYQSSLLALFVVGFTASDSVILLFVCSLVAIVDVFKYSLMELTNMLNEVKPDKPSIRKKIRQIVMQQLEIIEYESDLNERYFVSYFIQIFSGVMGISITLFLICSEGFIPGCALLLSLFGQLLEMCLLGTIFSVKNEEITDAIYDANWYLLETAEQKNVALMLQKSQQYVEMTIGGIKPLNIETFLRIMKSIYTYLMMMLNFVE